MPTFALTVGSLGDFVAMGDLIVKIGVALYRPGECVKDYQGLLRELQQFSQILSKIEICRAQRMTPIAQKCFDAIQAQADSTTKVIREFLDREEKQRDGIWNKLLWATNGPSEIAELKGILSVHREWLSLLMEMYLSTHIFYLFSI
jgi:hypothetical protein